MRMQIRIVILVLRTGENDHKYWWPSSWDLKLSHMLTSNPDLMNFSWNNWELTRLETFTAHLWCHFVVNHEGERLEYFLQDSSLSGNSRYLKTKKNMESVLGKDLLLQRPAHHHFWFSQTNHTWTWVPPRRVGWPGTRSFSTAMIVWERVFTIWSSDVHQLWAVGSLLLNWTLQGGPPMIVVSGVISYNNPYQWPYKSIGNWGYNL